MSTSALMCDEQDTTVMSITGACNISLQLGLT